MGAVTGDWNDIRVDDYLHTMIKNRKKCHGQTSFWRQKRFQYCAKMFAVVFQKDSKYFISKCEQATSDRPDLHATLTRRTNKQSLVIFKRQCSFVKQEAVNRKVLSLLFMIWRLCHLLVGAVTEGQKNLWVDNYICIQCFNKEQCYGQTSFSQAKMFSVFCKNVCCYVLEGQ